MIGKLFYKLIVSFVTDINTSLTVKLSSFLSVLSLVF